MQQFRTICSRKRQVFGNNLNISQDEFSYSSGWLTNFKRRYGIAQYKRCGEAASADMTIVNKGRQELQSELAKYDPDDIFKQESSLLSLASKCDISIQTSAGC